MPGARWLSGALRPDAARVIPPMGALMETLWAYPWFVWAGDWDFVDWQEPPLTLGSAILLTFAAMLMARGAQAQGLVGDADAACRAARPVAAGRSRGAPGAWRRPRAPGHRLVGGVRRRAAGGGVRRAGLWRVPAVAGHNHRYGDALLRGHLSQVPLWPTGPGLAAGAQGPHTRRRRRPNRAGVNGLLRYRVPVHRAALNGAGQPESRVGGDAPPRRGIGRGESPVVLNAHGGSLRHRRRIPCRRQRLLLQPGGGAASTPENAGRPAAHPVHIRGGAAPGDSGHPAGVRLPLPGEPHPPGGAADPPRQCPARRACGVSWRARPRAAFPSKRR